MLHVNSCSKLQDVTSNKFMSALVKTFKDNMGRHKNGFRYKDEIIPKFSRLVYLLGGRYLYEILQKNLSLPSVSTVLNGIKASSLPVIEGDFRFDELKTYLGERGVPLAVWISEDGTRIKSNIQYDLTSNCVVGFVLPLNEYGCPIVKSFQALSAETVQDIFKCQLRSNYAYVIMAQPVSTSVPPFCLAVFGSNNRFQSSDVIKRWEWMKKEAALRGIEILGFSSDADSRLLRSMRQEAFSAKLDNPIAWEDWFVQDIVQTVSYIQDTPHIGTKCRTRLTKPSIVLVMGNFTVSPTHLNILMSEASKLEHKLTASDLNNEDKMNFKAVERITQSKVIDLLDHVPFSQGTKSYLELMRLSLQAFLDKECSPCERIFSMWKCIFFLRLWRLWLEQKDYSTSKNFITAHTYYCLELNAHALIAVIRKFRDKNLPQYFLPWLFNSQACESFFRAMRSFTSTHSTVVNFDMLELLQKLRRIQLKCELIFELENDLVFPREERKKTDSLRTAAALCQHGLPCDAEILKTVKEARRAALKWAESLGMLVDFPPLLPPNRLFLTNVEKKDKRDENLTFSNTSDSDHVSTELLSDIQEDARLVSVTVDTISSVPVLSPSSPFVLYKDIGGRECVIRKSTLCWLLNSGSNRLSSDRLVRVQAKEKVNDEQSFTCSMLTCDVEQRKSVELGDWCAFKRPDGDCDFDNIVIGRILSFSYLSGKGKSRHYSALSAPIVQCETVPQEGSKEVERRIGCLATWFEISVTGVLLPLQCDTEFKDLKNYVCSLPRPKTLNDKLHLDCSVVEKIAKFCH